MAATIGADGTVLDLQAVSGSPEFRSAALEAVRHWTYKPYLLNGRPVVVHTTVTVNFKLDSSSPGF